jgi:hypothetical protein
MVATRAVLDDAYADGTLGSGLQPGEENYLNTGSAALGNASIKVFDIGLLSMRDFPPHDDALIYWDEALKLVEGGGDFDWTKGSMSVHFFAPNTSEYNLFNAPAWQATLYPEGWGGPSDPMPDKPVIRVYYGMRVELDSDGQLGDLADAVIDPNAGYTVFHLDSSYDLIG